MIKKRPVVVVSCIASHTRQLCCVVPVSTTAPMTVQAWHHRMPHLRIQGWPAANLSWAKCDMLATVSFKRLDQPYIKSRQGGRRYIATNVTIDDLAAIRAGIRSYLDL